MPSIQFLHLYEKKEDIQIQIRIPSRKREIKDPVYDNQERSGFINARILSEVSQVAV